MTELSTTIKNYLDDHNKDKCPRCNISMIHDEGSFWICPVCGYLRNRWWDNPRVGKPIEIRRNVFLCNHDNDLDRVGYD